MKIKKIPYSFFSSKITRLAIQQNPINYSYQKIEKKESKRKSLFVLNSSLYPSLSLSQKVFHKNMFLQLWSQFSMSLPEN